MPPSVTLEYKDYTGVAPVLEYKSAPAAVNTQQVGNKGIVDAYVAVTGIRDDVGDIIEPGAFTESLKKIHPKMCLGHDWNRPIGEPVEIVELMPGDPRLPKQTHDGQAWPAEAGALWTRSRYMLDTEDGRNAYAAALFYGPKTAYSIGYVPDKSKVRFVKRGGQQTRMLPKLDLYEYGPVLHGANNLARQAGVKSGQPADLEGKIRLVRNMEYWGLPIGTPIRPGMTPRGPVARKREREGKPVDENLGVVEIDPNNPKGLLLKPTAKGKAKRKDGFFESDIITLFADNPGAPPDPDGDDFETWDQTPGPDKNKVLKGGSYNPLDMLVANAVTPAELEEELRNNSEWGRTLGEIEDANASPEVAAFIDDVMDAYREKYNAALVQQNTAGQRDDIAEADDGSNVDLTTEPAPGGARRSTTSLTLMGPAEVEAAAREMSNDELAAHEAELAARADSLGKPGQRNRAHEAIAAELERRKGTPPEQAAPAAGDAPPADEPGTVVPADTRPQGFAIPPPPADDQQPTTPAASGPRDARIKPGETSPAETPEGTETAPDIGAADVPAGDVPASVDSEVDTGADIPDDIPAEDDQVIPGEEVPPGEGDGDVVETPETAIEDQQEDGQFEPGAVLGDDGKPVPNVPVNDAGDYYDPHGDIVSGQTPFDAALNAAGDALLDDDYNGLIAALQPFKSRIDPPEGADQFDPAAEAERLLGQPRAQSLAEVESWTEQANSRFADEEGRDRDDTIDVLRGVDDDYLATEAARIRGDLITHSASGSPANDPYTREMAMRLRAILAEQNRRTEGQDTAEAPTLPTPDDVATLTAEDVAEANSIADASHGIYEADDGEFEAEPDIVDRQDRIAGLLTSAQDGAVDFSGYSDDGLRSTRADVVSELRLQDYLTARRSQERAVAKRERDNATTTPGETTEPDGQQDEPEGPKPRPGVAGAAEDFADALDDGDEERIRTTRARLESSLRRSRSDSEHVATLRGMLESGQDVTPEQLRATAEAIRIETRERRNQQARDRRKVRRFERDRLRNLLQDVESVMTGRGLAFDAVPEASEDLETPNLGTPGAGSWSTRNEPPDWTGRPVTVHEVSGTGYAATVFERPDGRVSYEWEVQPALTGSGDAGSADDAKTMIELIMDTQRARGILSADAVIPQAMPRTASSRLPNEVTSGRVDAIETRLTEGRLNPLTGLEDPLRSRPKLRPPVVRAFDQPGDVQEYLLAQVSRETGDTKRDRLASQIARVRWDDVTLSPGGGLAVVSTAGGRGYQIMHTRSGTWADITVDGVGSASLGKADQLRIAAIMESLPDDQGRVIDFNQDLENLREQLKAQTHGGKSGATSWPDAVMNALIAEKLRTGQWSSKLVSLRPISSLPWHDRTNHARFEAVNEKTTALLSLIVGKRKADQDTRLTIKGGWALAYAGAPDAAAVLFRRRAAELREEFGAKAGDRGAVLLDDIADNLLAMWAPEQSQGDRVRALKAGERVTITEGEEVRTYRALTDMRSTSTYGGQSEAQVIDEATGATYRMGVWNNFSRKETLSLWPSTKGGNDIWSLPLSGNEFVITSDGETIPDTADNIREAARGDIRSIPQAVLDAAANLLTESRSEAEERRATGARSRTDARAPRRAAPKPPDEPQPVPGEQHLAVAQGRLLPAWIGENYSESDAPAPGGFTSEQEWREFISAEIGRLADKGTREGDGLKVINTPDYEKVTLSPGGHFVITRSNYVIHARSMQAVWGMSSQGWELTNGAPLTASGSAAIAAGFERALLNGKRPDWTKDANRIGPEIRKFTKANGSIMPPVVKAAYERLLADGKTLRAGDLDAFEAMTRELGQGFTPPNPSALRALDYGADNPMWSYRQAGGSNLPHTPKERVGVATTKAGSTLAKKVDSELRLATAISRVAPLDAVRRLHRLADQLDGQEIETVLGSGSERGPGKSLNPAADLRKVAKAITDGYDENQISPAGMLLRHNFTGTVRPRQKVKPTTKFHYNQPATDERYADVDMTEIRVWTDADGVKHATFADHHLVDPPVGYTGEFEVGKARTNTVPGKISRGAIRVRNDGRISLTWNDIGGLPTSVDIDDWEFEPPQQPDESGDAIPGERPSGNGLDENRTEPDGATSDNATSGESGPDTGVSPVTPVSGAQGALNRDAAQVTREKEALKDLDLPALRERLADARRRAGTDVSAQEEARVLRREIDARESAEQDVAKAPGAPNFAQPEAPQGQDAEIEQKIEQVYTELAKGRGSWIGLVDLRDRLGEEIPRAEVDRVLKQMSRDRRVNIAPESNRKVLNERDHAAALRIGGEEQHLLMFP